MLKRKRYLWKCVCLIILLIFYGQLSARWQEYVKEQEINVGKKMAQAVFQIVMEQNTPVLAFLQEEQGTDLAGLFWEQLNPMVIFEKPQEADDSWIESKFRYEEQTIMEEVSQSSTQEITQEEPSKEPETQIEEAVETQQSTEFVPAVQKEVVYTAEQLSNPDYIKETFYTVDPTTQIDSQQLSYEKLVDYDASIEKRTDGKPQILIYHTHSQETYADSVLGDSNTSVVGVGDYLARILQEKYGYEVLHHKGEYDKESRDYAYSYAAKGLQQVLKENPTIEVIIDLHRDAVKEGTRLVTQLQGKEVAKFMFFNGMCYTNGVGKLERLPNVYMQDNLSFAFQLKLAAEEYYPGLTRKTYLKGYRYNMQYCPKSLLIEVGAQTNTVEEAMNACEPMAHLLSLVLEGKNRQ